MSSSREVVIVSACRTAIGRFQGSLSTLRAPDLGAVAIREAVRRAQIEPESVDEVIMGNVVQAGQGQAPARQAAVKAGIPPSVGATTINKMCGSGLKAVMMAASAVKAGDADAIVAGGMESMNQGPYLLLKARTGYRLGNDQIYDATVLDGLWCMIDNWHMGNAAEFIASQYCVTREEQDRLALKSHQKAITAINEGRFKEEIVPVEVPQGRGAPLVFDTDECPRADTSLEALARLRPAFEQGGAVTAGNAPGITDGASAVVVMGADVAERRGLKPLARITGYTQAGVEPKWVFIAPARAVEKLLKQTGQKLADIDLIEANEAFAAQSITVGKLLDWDWSKVNVNGGAIALGHPIGASGSRLLATLIYALKDRGLKKGMATLCLAGGEAVAMSIEAI